MSNNRNLGNIATAITNATSGQVLTSQGSGVATFADAGGTGVTVHTNQAAMLTDAASADEGSLHYETAENKLYVKQSSGFFLLASITNTAPTVSGFTETTGSGSATTIADNGTFALTSGSNTVITLTASDPDLETLVYSATVTSGTASNVISSPSLPISNQSGNTFTLTPVTSGTGGTIIIRFDVSDGNNVVNKTHSFSIAFKVVDSNYTTLLATATGTSDNNNITDSSSNTYSITVAGDAHAGTFSPYRSGGYSTYFDGTGDYLATTSSNYALGTSGAFTLELWYYFEDARTHTLFDSYPSGYVSGNGEAKLAIIAGGSGGSGDGIYLYGGAEVGNLLSVSRTFSVGVWEHFCWTRDTSGNHTFYINGTQIGTSTATPDIDINLLEFGRRGGSFNSTFMNGYLSDVRLVKGTAITPPSGGPTERLEAVTNTSLLTCHLPYIADGSTNSHSITINGDVSTKPFSPYDYEEYDATDHGGSVYFDGVSPTTGTGDRIEIAGHSSLVLDTSDFTVEFWYKHVANVATMRFLGNNYQNSTWGGGRWTMGIVSGKLIFQINSLHGSSQTASTVNIDDGFWHHCSLTRNGSTFTLRVDGGDAVTYNNSGSVDGGNSYGFTVGSRGSGNESIDGYISDFRIVKGTAVYSGNFTPPTGPLTTTGGTYPSATNVNTSITASNTSLLIKGTDASIIDKSQGSNLKLFGDTTGSTTQAKFSNTKSMYFDGTGDYITAGADAGNFGTGDFTIETWLRASSWNKALFRKTTTTSSSSPPSISVYMTSATILTGVNSGAADGTWMSATNPFSLNTWGHFAITRVNGLVNVYANGSRIISTTRAVDVDNNITFRIGEWRNSTEYFTGYLQDFRITKGLARYTAADETANIPSAPLEG